MENRNKQQNNSTPIFAKMVDSFSEAFPNIEDIAIEITELNNHGGIELARKLNRQNFLESINCSKSGCCGGGLEIGSIVREMIGQKFEKNENSLSCKGRIGSQNGRKIYGNGICWHHFKYNIEIKYLPEE